MNTINVRIVWAQTRPDILSGLVRVQTVFECCKQTKIAGKELRFLEN